MLYFLKANYEKEVFESINIESGECETKELFEMFREPDNKFYVKNLNLDYDYIKEEFFKHGMKAKIYDRGVVEKGEFAVLCTKDNKYLIKLSNGTEIRNFSTLIPNIDLSKVDEDEDMAVIKSIIKCNELGIKGVSIGSSAYNSWKYSSKETLKSTQTRFIDKYIDKDDLRIIRDSYKGSINCVNEDNKWTDEKSITVDCNSLYPFWLLQGYIPYGKPIRVNYKDWKNGKSNKQYKKAIVKVVLDGKVKKGHNAVFGVKNNIGKYDYKDKIEGVFNIWEEELEEIEKNYDFASIEKIDVLAFKVTSGKRFFGDFFEKYKSLKEKSKDDYLSRLIAKLMLNNLIGKFATKNELYISLEVSENKYEFVKSENYNYYCALASFVNSKSRTYMMSLINMFGKNFIYCDTDSITFKGNKIPHFFEDMIEDNTFGKFKIESKNKYFHLLKCKQYEKMTEKGLKRVISGCPIKNLYDFKKFECGVNFPIDVMMTDITTGKPFIKKTNFQLG